MYMLPTRDSLQILKTHRDCKWRDGKKKIYIYICHANGNEKKAGIGIFILRQNRL